MHFLIDCSLLKLLYGQSFNILVEFILEGGGMTPLYQIFALKNALCHKVISKGEKITFFCFGTKL